MILDQIDNAARYFRLHPGFDSAFRYLKQSDLRNLSPGRHDIDGERLFLMLNKGSGRGTEEVKLEFHRRYIDIQFTITGPEVIGWKPLSACTQVMTPFDADKDFGLFADRPEIWISVPPGHFAIFFPDDAHAPTAAPAGSDLLKAVLKVTDEWL